MRERIPHAMIVFAVVSMCLALDRPMVAAQSSDMVGERVRVGLLDSGRTEGVVVNWGTQTLSVRTDRDSVWTSEWSDVAGVEWLRTRRRTARGLGLGLVIGGLGTGLVGAIAVDPCSGTGFCIGPDSRTESALVFGLLGAALGAAAGLIVGTAVQTSSWEPLTIPGRDSSAVGVRWRVSR
jgi:hypothetical protein